MLTATSALGDMYDGSGPSCSKVQVLNSCPSSSSSSTNMGLNQIVGVNSNSNSGVNSSASTGQMSFEYVGMHINDPDAGTSNSGGG